MRSAEAARARPAAALRDGGRAWRLGARLAARILHRPVALRSREALPLERRHARRAPATSGLRRLLSGAGRLLAMSKEAAIKAAHASPSLKILSPQIARLKKEVRFSLRFPGGA